jgi:steroid 5-alpha reductase family enzyme
MSEPWLWLAWAWGAAAVGMAGVWFVCHKIKNAGYVDVAWAFSIGVGVVIASVMLDGYMQRKVWVAVIGAAWAWRLAWHLFKRLYGKEEDGRYAHMRKHFGDKAPLAFFVFFQMQAVFVVLFLAPMVAALTFEGPLGWRLPTGIVIWLIAIGGELLADKQLADFKADPNEQGKVCKRGLWRYSRHPNYFFEWVHWFAYLAIGATLTTSIGYAALAGPVVMGVFLIFVTGIPYTEMRAVQSKGEAYKQYQRETSAFVPWFPKKAAQA